jgi:uncharacterized protein YecT (DUF1311 family)
MIGACGKVRVWAVLAVLMVASAAHGAEMPTSFIGTYQREPAGCTSCFLVLRKDVMTLDDCKRLPYTVREVGEKHVILEVPFSPDCPASFVRLECVKRHDGVNPVSLEIGVSTHESLSKARAGSAEMCRFYCRVDPSLAEDQTASFLHGKATSERRDALHKINLQIHPERDKYNEIGLKDPAPEVRGIAAWFLRGQPEVFVPMLINVMVADPDARVRASAAHSLSRFYTDNGSDGYLHTKPLEENLEKFLTGLQHAETLPSALKILGYGCSGRTFVPCSMSVENRKKVLIALRNQAETIRPEAETLRMGSSGQGNGHGHSAKDQIPVAIENITTCRPDVRIVRSQPTVTASFDCEKATSDVERMICGDDELSRLDKALNEAYVHALDQTLFQEQLVHSQRQWMKKNRDACKNKECIKKAYETRIKELSFLSSQVTVYASNGCVNPDVNLKPFQPLSEPFKAIFAMYAMQAGSCCEGIRDVTCGLTSALGLGSQCSKEQLSLVRKWFRDEIPRMGKYGGWANKETQKPGQLESICYKTPDAREQERCEGITVRTRKNLVYVDAVYYWTLTADGPSGYTGYSTVYRITKDRIIVVSHQRVLYRRTENDQE